MGRPRVLVLTPDYPPAKGGIQLLLDRTVRNFERFDVHVVTLASPKAPPMEAPDAWPATRLKWPAFLPHRGRILLLNAAGVLHALRERPDVVLSGHIVTGPAARLLRLRAGLPYVQLVYASELARSPKIARLALGAASSVVTISRHTAELAIRAGGDPSHLHMAFPGVDPLENDVPDSSRNGPPTILVVARMVEIYKGHDVLLRAMPLVRAKVPGARIVMVGDGPLRPYYDALVASLGLQDAVHFTGTASNEERDNWFAASHVFAMPSRLPPDGGGEGFGIVYLEAATRGLPSVGGTMTGASDAVVHGETGLLVDNPGDHVAVARALVELLTDPERARRLGEAGEARARTLTWAAFAREVEDKLLQAIR